MNAALGLWAETRGGRATLINHSENHTFRIELPDGRRYALRVHRPGYQSARAIESELEWVLALRGEGALPVPRPIAGRDGKLLQSIVLSGIPRYAVLFDFEAGAEPSPGDDLGGLFVVLGRLAGLAHEHAARFAPSPGFTRQVWNAAAILDPGGIWGDWRSAPQVEGAVARTLEMLDARLRADLAAYGEGPDRFGLIHADMRLANL
ncbi:MAG TPA: phosphotransferase, partial [Devosia sp.]|nr:phosphotransferase [Devosia sp.]